MKRWFTLKFRYYRHFYYSDCSLCISWCDYLTSCLGQNWSWQNNCRRKFKYYKHFYLTTVPKGKDLPLLVIDVNLCKRIIYRYSRYRYSRFRYSRNFDKIFTIKLTEHRNGTGSIKNGLYKLILCLINDVKVIFCVNYPADSILHL